MTIVPSFIEFLLPPPRIRTGAGLDFQPFHSSCRSFLSAWAFFASWSNSSSLLKRALIRSMWPPLNGIRHFNSGTTQVVTHKAFHVGENLVNLRSEFCFHGPTGSYICNSYQVEYGPSEKHMIPFSAASTKERKTARSECSGGGPVTHAWVCQAASEEVLKRRSQVVLSVDSDED